ncbi:hypothetical protein CA54_56730 [Symmachiella macrocystis]|uniref:Uncharacterized protein n=1 Tax=Symmachiella macrocystis TaxID=2527985 RepID=A0A5C6B5P8_9PLAN|nr:hypothetical protein [Symmachiella macrocystis]TWU07268.1 hypothetical protein CA54_56730 [Symmachiella macrocystis]
MGMFISSSIHFRTLSFIMLGLISCLGITQTVFAQSSRGRTVSLQSVPLTSAVGNVQKITLSGSLDQGGEMVFDGNQYSAPDRFGDFQKNTGTYFPPVAVRFAYVDMPDPTGKRRKVYEILGALQPAKSRYYLVSPSKKTGDYRLVIDRPGEDRRVISLEAMAEPALPNVRVPRILKIEHALLKSNPPTLVVTVTGQVNTAGWTEAKLTRRVYVQPPADGIWEYDLFATPPAGNPPAAVAMVKATNRWPNFDATAVKGVRVFGVDDGVVEVRF